MHSAEKEQLTIAAKGTALHLLAVVACAIGIYLMAPISLRSSGQGTIVLAAMLMLYGFVSVLKLIGYLVSVTWHLLWFITSSHSRRKRQLELWGCVAVVLGVAVLCLNEGMRGITSGKVVYAFSRHVGVISVGDAPFLYWLSEVGFFFIGMLSVYLCTHASIRLLRGLPPNPAVQGTLRDKAAQRP